MNNNLFLAIAENDRNSHSCFTLNVMTELELVAFPLLHTLERVYISYISQLRTREDDEGFRLENFLFRSLLL